MLRSDLRYVCLDFETTGLDADHDEAIQIGIVQFDHTGKTVDTFSSFIKPQKPAHELKDMVRVVTWLKMEDLLQAPHFDEIKEKVASFFDKQTVLIGHNVQFDVRVLQQHMQFDTHAIIDTFPLAQALIPFSSSYALEVLDKSVGTTKDERENGSHHDALYDAYATKNVFLACIARIEKSVNKYPQIERYIKAASGPLHEILKVNSEVSTFSQAIPSLTKHLNGDKKLSLKDELDKGSLPDKWNFFIGNNPLKEVLKKLPKDNVIFAFSQRHKVNIARQLLHDMWLNHVETWSPYIFDKDLLSLFFQKTHFDEQELYFALKYFFHATSEHSSIDLTSQYDRKIYHALKEKNTVKNSKAIELITHEQLYEKVRDQEIMPFTSIFFFDQDRRYDTHMKWEQKPFDLYLLLQITDSLIYKHKLIAPQKSSLWEELHTKLVIFIGVRQTEVAGLLKDVSNSSVDIDNIIDNTYFYKVSLLIAQISELISSLEDKTDSDEHKIIHEKWERFMTIISSRCWISTKIYGEEVHFLVRKLDAFLDYSEFQDLFSIFQTSFLSIIKKDRPAILTSSTEKLPTLIHQRPGKEHITYEWKNIYIFSNNKQVSQEALVWLHTNSPKQYKVHGENITGWKGKNIFAIKWSEYNIILGGYDFFLQCISQKVIIDKLYTLCINGPLQHIISGDLDYYGTTYSS